MQTLFDAIQAYKILRYIGYFFALSYSKKGKTYYDTNFLIRFEKENFRHLLGIQHLKHNKLIESNSKKLFDDLSNLTIQNCLQNKDFELILNDPEYNKIIDRLENIINFDKLLIEKNIKIYQKSESPKVLTKNINFEFLLKLNKYNNHLDDPFLFIKREYKDSVICNPTSTFRDIKPYEQNHKSRKILSLDITKMEYKK